VELVIGDAQLAKRTTVNSGFKVESAAQKVQVESLECVVPLKVYGAMRTLKMTERQLIFSL
jgi:hypothetical protein